MTLNTKNVLQIDKRTAGTFKKKTSKEKCPKRSKKVNVYLHKKLLATYIDD